MEAGDVDQDMPLPITLLYRRRRDIHDHRFSGALKTLSVTRSLEILRCAILSCLLRLPPRFRRAVIRLTDDTLLVKTFGDYSRYEKILV